MDSGCLHAGKQDKKGCLKFFFRVKLVMFWFIERKAAALRALRPAGQKLKIQPQHTCSIVMR